MKLFSLLDRSQMQPQHVLNINIQHLSFLRSTFPLFVMIWYDVMIHRLTLVKGVYSFRYFLNQRRIPNLLMHVFIMPNPFVICSCMNTCISRFGIRIGRRKYLNEYTPFGNVTLWIAGSLYVMSLHPPQQLRNYHLFVLLGTSMAWWVRVVYFYLWQWTPLVP